MLLISVALLFAVLWGAKVVLLDRGRVPETTNHAIDLDRVRSLARSVPGQLPLRVNLAITGESNVPRTVAVAGGGFGAHRMLRTAYQVVYRDGTGVIDAAMDRDLHENLAPGSGPFLEEGYAAIQDGLAKARWIVITHEHPDHWGGIARSPHLASIVPQLRLTRAQIANDYEIGRVGWPADVLGRIRAIEYEDLYALAPGVVLIKAPGHTPGTQLIYVSLEDGRELLFLGDVAWHDDQLTEETGRPLLIARFLVGEDRAVVQSQLRALIDLRRREPGIEYIISHDAELHEAALAEGRLGPRFE